MRTVALFAGPGGTVPPPLAAAVIGAAMAPTLEAMNDERRVA